MAEEYPCRLPGVLVSSNSYNDQNTVERNDLDSGPPVYRLRSTSGWVSFNVGWRFTKLQVQVFRNWHQITLARGSKLFVIPLMVDGYDGTDNTIDHECYFDGPPRYTQSGQLWTVQARLLAIERAGLDECAGLALVNAYSAFEDLDYAIKSLDGTIKLMEDIWQP